MVDKKSPVKRLSVAKSTRAPRSKKLNLDKLITSIKNISTRYKKNGKMSGGAYNWGTMEGNSDFSNVRTEIEKFFRNKSDFLGKETPFFKACKEIESIKGDDTKKQNLLDSIKKFTGNNNDSLSSYLNTFGPTQPILSKIDRVEDKMKFFTDSNNFFGQPDGTIPPVYINAPDRSNEENKTIAYLSIFHIANTLAKIYKLLQVYNQKNPVS
jgi:hypothetical protein